MGFCGLFGQARLNFPAERGRAEWPWDGEPMFGPCEFLCRGYIRHYYKFSQRALGCNAAAEFDLLGICNIQGQQNHINRYQALAVGAQDLLKAGCMDQSAPFPLERLHNDVAQEHVRFHDYDNFQCVPTGHHGQVSSS